ncbi:hypothetical protein JKP75_12850 [Blastococcus sp. TML/M2B]|uniref:hypothetical protein n=1 Tax=unclassified Blastococcus TaxID=2619396 RepID=UPI00190B788E|nr:MULTISPECIES: hypothetical protein [unclassified Blastococcus]MBN1093371.1 hypothetical protein [Blastococcus sp. TML/M2B]MBN1096510.1 hypothetical protein [Blastococcus sp. TML/C7B]
MANAGTVLTARPTPEVARRAWPQWLALGAAMIAVAVASTAWSDGGSRLLLGALGLFLAVRGGVLLRTAPGLDGELAGRARTLGTVAAGAGVVALVVALVSEVAAARVLLVAVPVVLLGGALALLTRTGAARRGGQVLLVWGLLVTGLLVVTGLAQDWARASDAATVVAALMTAALAVPVLVSAVNLRAVAAQPAPAPVGGGCGGCACGAGGCGS